ncbi:MAG: aminotransferase class V-fold PLP-dependent enzyme [Sphaerochaetaceae bacterium]|nr:aminotransferase class V-fold PLP-dependent enzyme [Sphaerochaetaceae bacterium]
MKRIYLDNAATSYPKAPGISNVMKKFLEEGCSNPNRTNSLESFNLFNHIYNTRCLIAKLYNLDTPESVCFSSGITESLNQIIKGLFSANDHIIVSGSEHNSVMRPLVQMGIPFSRIPTDNQGYILKDHIQPLIQFNTKALIICAASNVTGAIQDIKTIAQIANDNNLLLFIDSAQATPHVNLDMKAYNIDGVAFTGHKGLLGPEGIGGLALKKEIALKINPLISGGTGSQSDSEDIPSTLPDRLEAGTQNIPGILALEQSLEYVIKNKDKLEANTKAVTNLLYEGVSNIEGLTIVGAPLDRPRTSVISVISNNKDNVIYY